MRVERLDPLAAMARDLRTDDQVDDDGMPGLCRNGMPHIFDGVECRICGALPYESDDRPAGWYAPQPYPGHVCFDGCRHRV